MLELLKKSAMEQSKALKNKEMDEIQNIIQTIIDVDVDFDTPKSLGLSSIKKTFKQETIVSETTFHRGSLRSGQRLEVDGSVVILGDVNSGAEVMASDNIVILGNLRGLAHIVREIDREEETLHKQAYIHVVDDKIEIE